MAKKLNKSLVGSLVVTLMILFAAVGFVLVQNLPGSDPQVFANDAKQLEQKGEYANAMMSYQRAYAKDDTKNPEYLVSAARCAVEVGDIATAQQLFANALTNSPQFAPAHVAQLKLELEIARLVGNDTNRWQRVLDLATSASKLPDLKESAFVNSAMGQALLALQSIVPSNREKGLEALRRANEIDPSDYETTRTLAVALASSAKEKELRRNPDDARADMDAAFALVDSAIAKAREDDKKKDLQELEMFRAKLLTFDGKPGEALEALKKLTAGELVEADPLIELASIYMGFVSRDIPRDLDKAEACLKRAIEVDPQNGVAYLTLGNLYQNRMSQTDDEAAQNELQKKQTALYTEALGRIKKSDHFRDYRENQNRIRIIQELFLADIRAANNATDDAEKQTILKSAENWVAQMKEELPANSQMVLFLSAHLDNAHGDIIQATREGEAALKAGGGRPYVPLLRLMAELYSRQQQWGLVQDMLEQALDATRSQPMPDLYLQMAQFLIQQGKPAEALRYLKPESPEGLRKVLLENKIAARLRMQAYVDLGQPDLAKLENPRAVEGDTLDDKLRDAYMMFAEKDYNRAEQAVRKLCDEYPEEAAPARFMVQVLKAAGRDDDAMQFIRDLVAAHPDVREFRRLEIVMEPDSPERNEKLLAFIDSIDDEKTRNLEYAAFYRNNGDFAKEQEYLDRAEQSDPKNPGILELQLAAALRAEDWKRGQAYVDKFKQYDADGADGKIAAGRLALAHGQRLRQAGKDDPEAERLLKDSVELLRQGLEVYPSSSIGWTYLAQAYLILNDTTQAKLVLDNALEKNSRNGFAAKMRAQIAADENDQPTLRKYLAVTASTMPNDDWVLSMEQLLKEQENPVEGIAGRVAQREKDPNDVPNLYQLARLYKDPKVGEYAKAEEVYRDALAKAPENLGLLREVAYFLASENVGKPQEGESLLLEKLQNTKDKPTEAQLAVSLAEFYAQLDRYNTADRYYRLAMRLDPSARVLSLAADFYRRAKRYNDSIEILDKLIALPDLDEDHAKNARSRKIAALLAMNELDRARTAIDEYRAEYPDDDQGWIYEGAWHRVAGDIKKAEEAFNRQLAKNPDSAVALWQRGQLYMLQNKFKLAITDLQRAKSVKPTAFNYQHRILLADAFVEVGRYDEAIQELNEILKEDPSQDRVAEALIETYQRVDPPRYTEAEDVIYRYMRKNPRDYQWPMKLGQLGEKSRDIRKQVTGYAKAAELSQDQPEAVRSLFDALREGNDTQGIINYATQKITPTALDRSPIALSDLAWAYHQKGDSEKCIEAFKRSLAAAGNDFRTYTRIIKDMFALLGPENALNEMKKAANADPSNLLKRRSLVHLYWLNGRIPDAIDVAQQIQDQAVSDDDVFFARLAKGMLYSAKGDPEKAREEYEAALEINPNQPMVLNNLSYLLAETLNRPKDALPYAKKAARLQPNNPDILDTYGWIEALNGQTGEAAGTLLRALEVDSRHCDALLHLARVHMMRGECIDAKRRLNYLKDCIDKRMAERITDAEKQGLQAYLPKISETLDKVEHDCG